MAKSFSEYFGDFNTMRDKLMYAIGDLAQIPQRATNLEPRVKTLMASSNNVLQDSGKKIYNRLVAVRDLARSEFTKTQALLNEMLTFKETIEKNPVYASFTSGITAANVTAAISGLFKKDDTTIETLQKAAGTSISLISRATAELSVLNAASAEVKTLETLAQQVADYGQGKGLLPAIADTGAGITAGDQAALSPAMLAAGMGAAAVVFYFLRRREKIK